MATKKSTRQVTLDAVVHASNALALLDQQRVTDVGRAVRLAEHLGPAHDALARPLRTYQTTHERLVREHAACDDAGQTLYDVNPRGQREPRIEAERAEAFEGAVNDLLDQTVDVPAVTLDAGLVAAVSPQVSVLRGLARAFTLRISDPLTAPLTAPEVAGGDD